ncbi:MAG: four-carbon acid sugar kinase family protein, partial [Candidatus Sericytochromatia bacterium]|nr:four-carbon acid sugar kinase family protein [Candidatus Sericytochromatia bacterium]
MRGVDPRLLAQGPTGVLAGDWPAAAEAAAALGDGDGWVVDGPTAVPPGATLAVVTVPTGVDPPAVARRTREAARTLQAHRCARHFLHCPPDGGTVLAAQLPAALAELALPLAVVTSAHPAAGVTCIGGYTLQEGRPTCLPHGGAPLGRGHLPAVLGEGRPAAHLGLDGVLEGPRVVAQAIAEAWGAGQRVLVVDAAREEDLAAIARAIVITPYPILPVGSTG